MPLTAHLPSSLPRMLRSLSVAVAGFLLSTLPPPPACPPGTRSSCATCGASTRAWCRCCRPTPSSGADAGVLVDTSTMHDCGGAIVRAEGCSHLEGMPGLRTCTPTGSPLRPGASCPCCLLPLSQRRRAPDLHQPGGQRRPHHGGQHAERRDHQVGLGGRGGRVKHHWPVGWRAVPTGLGQLRRPRARCLHDEPLVDQGLAAL